MSDEITITLTRNQAQFIAGFTDTTEESDPMIIDLNRRVEQGLKYASDRPAMPYHHAGGFIPVVTYDNPRVPIYNIQPPSNPPAGWGRVPCPNDEWEPATIQMLHAPTGMGKAYEVQNERIDKLEDGLDRLDCRCTAIASHSSEFIELQKQVQKQDEAIKSLRNRILGRDVLAASARDSKPDTVTIPVELAHRLMSHTNRVAVDSAESIPRSAPAARDGLRHLGAAAEEDADHIRRIINGEATA